MNVTLISMGVAGILAIGLLVNIVVVNYLLGSFEFLFGKPKLTILRSTLGKSGFAFGFKWNEDKEPAKFDTIKIRLFNPFSSPSQVEVTKKLAGSTTTFADDIDLGPAYPKLIESITDKNASVMVEITSSTEGIGHQFDMKASDFLQKLSQAGQNVEEFVSKNKYVPGKKFFHESKRSFIADSVPGAGKKLKVATNPEFSAEFAAAGGGSAAAVVDNFAVSKVWIDPGCIVCDACEAIFPEVFHVTETTCEIRPDAPLTDGLRIEEAAEACPVEVIKYNKA